MFNHDEVLKFKSKKVPSNGQDSQSSSAHEPWLPQNSPYYHMRTLIVALQSLEQGSRD
ncbi:MAG: hypothetical protein ACJAT7_002205, partial [Psychromonas sp.]